jgi:hypothetical protein
MSGPTVHQLKRALEEIRDEMTDVTKPSSGRALVWPLGCDILANCPTALTMLAAKLAEPPPVTLVKVEPDFQNCLQHREPNRATAGRMCIVCGMGPCHFSQEGARLRWAQS